jgi:predicted phosphodiesterase
MKHSKKWCRAEIELAESLAAHNYVEISQALRVQGFNRSPSSVRHLLNRLEKPVSGGCDCCNTVTTGYLQVGPQGPKYDPQGPWYDPDEVKFTSNRMHGAYIGDVGATACCGPDFIHTVTTPIPSHSADKSIAVDFGLDYWNALTDIETERQRLFNMITDEYSHIGNPKGKLFKVVSISDLHIPFVNDAVIKDMMEKHSDTDILVVNGDLLEQYSVSKWPKSKGIVLQHEYQVAVRYVEMFAKHFKKVVLTRGNHDERVAKYFASNIDPGVCFLTHPDPLERIAKGFDFTETGEFTQVHKFNNVAYFGGLCGWYAKVGKTIFAHPSGGSGVPMRTAVNVANYFLEKEDFDCIVCAHTHKMGQIIYKGKLIIEQGCACIPMDYEADSKMQYGQQSFGYAVVYMNAKGEVDFDKSRPVYYGTATCVDTDVRLNVGE